MTKHREPNVMRAKLLQAFGELMEESTYESITTRAIAKRAETSYSALYTYFGSKEELLYAYCESFEVLSGKQLMPALERLPKAKALSMTAEGLASFLYGLIAEDPDSKRATSVDINIAALSLRNEKIREYFVRSTDRWINSICDAIEYCEIPTEDKEATARYISALALGVEVYSRVLGDAWDPKPLLSMLGEPASARL